MWYNNKIMSDSKVINVDKNSQEFQRELDRRIKLAKNPKNRIPLSQARKDILKKYQELSGAKV
jgi:hypothetical protein